MHAIVSASPGAALSEASIMAHCRARIAAYKCPRSIDVRNDALPLSGANKIDKPALRAPWAGRSEPPGLNPELSIAAPTPHRRQRHGH